MLSTIPMATLVLYLEFRQKFYLQSDGYFPNPHLSMETSNTERALDRAPTIRDEVDLAIAPAYSGIDNVFYHPKLISGSLHPDLFGYGKHFFSLTHVSFRVTFRSLPFEPP